MKYEKPEVEQVLFTQLESILTTSSIIPGIPGGENELPLA